MARTLTLSCTTGGITDITVQTVCKRVVVFENVADAVTVFKYRSSSADPWVVLQKGLALDFDGFKPHPPGELLGQLQTVGSDAEFGQLEL